MKNKKLINWLALSGVISVIFYILHDIIGGINYPGYNALSQAVSDLTAIDSPAFFIANKYSTIYGIFNCLCCALLSILIRNEENKLLRIGIYMFSIMNYISGIGYALFPLSSSGFDGSIQSIIHVYVITLLVVLLSIVSLILIAVGSFKGKKKHRYLGWLAIFTFILMFIGAIGSNAVPKEYFGLLERFSTYSVVIFTGILGLYGFNVFQE